MIDYLLFKKIENYAIEHLKSSNDYYLKRKQNKDKIFLHILRGKIAEFNCYFQLLNLGYMLDPPDLKIYTTHKSTFSDLIIKGKNNVFYLNPKYVHVKSISKETWNNPKFPKSFLIQKNDKIVLNPSENHFFSVLVQESLIDYRFERWIKTTEANYQPTIMDMPSKWAVFL